MKLTPRFYIHFLLRAVAAFLISFSISSLSAFAQDLEILPFTEITEPQDHELVVFRLTSQFAPTAGEENYIVWWKGTAYLLSYSREAALEEAYYPYQKTKIAGSGTLQDLAAHFSDKKIHYLTTARLLDQDHAAIPEIIADLENPLHPYPTLFNPQDFFKNHSQSMVYETSFGYSERQFSGDIASGFLAGIGLAAIETSIYAYYFSKDIYINGHLIDSIFAGPPYGIASSTIGVMTTFLFKNKITNHPRWKRKLIFTASGVATCTLILAAIALRH